MTIVPEIPAGMVLTKYGRFWTERFETLLDEVEKRWHSTPAQGQETQP
ncbi:MAG TPA: hypothetical protein VI542_10035 [Candidatus Tectomicrobia bacterium]